MPNDFHLSNEKRIKKIAVPSASGEMMPALSSASCTMGKAAGLPTQEDSGGSRGGQGSAAWAGQAAGQAIAGTAHGAGWNAHTEQAGGAKQPGASDALGAERGTRKVC